ncbi:MULTISPECIES: hypothetical protein [unclassified Yoonia]|uniref:hypothetical protein n=1 Tax=unclassified Yoonia TaxID=2629118 RepID=UPI002B002EDF|nr:MULTISPECIES: hypothetical protein [unclassified Yoonia]
MIKIEKKNKHLIEAELKKLCATSQKEHWRYELAGEIDCEFYIEYLDYPYSPVINRYISDSLLCETASPDYMNYNSFVRIFCDELLGRHGKLDIIRGFEYYNPKGVLAQSCEYGVVILGHTHPFKNVIDVKKEPTLKITIEITDDGAFMHPCEDYVFVMPPEMVVESREKNKSDANKSKGIMKKMYERLSSFTS